MATIREESQLAAPGALVELYTLDLNPIGVNSIYRWTPSVISGVGGPNLTYGGLTYVYRDIKLSNVEISGNGNINPRLEMGNVGNIAGALATQNGDLVGAILTRVQTFRHHLDDGSDPDPNEHYPEEVYEIKQKTGQNRTLLSFELGPVEDVTDVELPRRICLAKVCPFRYRYWDAVALAYDYSKATCPYTGSNKFKVDGTSTTVSAEDICGKTVRDCSLRFPDQTLPYGGFPGMEA